MSKATVLKAGHLGNAVLLSQPNGGYTLVPLPNEAQLAPLYGLCTGDFDQDGHADILAGGNFLGAKPEFGYVDADYGIFLKGDGKGGFRPMRTAETGFMLHGEVRDIRLMNIAGKPTFAIAINDQPIEFWRYKNR